MRAGGYTVHQSLTAEAAAVLKLALGLARSRGHAQVTPLHVAFTLLGSSAASSPQLFTPPAAAATPYGLLRRACAKAHPTGASGCCLPAAVSSHPARCRALELCFNVALNRLPTSSAVGSPLSSSPSSCSSGSSGASSTPFMASLVQPSPTLSNALVAALKRAQANQRRGCVELQSLQPPPPPPTPSSQQLLQQQPVLTIKIELDQLIVSILDDPSVSRVMREAGFSSAAIKTNLEEESVVLLGLGHHHGSSTLSSSSHPPAVAVTSKFSLKPYSGLPTHASGGGGGALWPAQFLNQPEVEPQSTCRDEDVAAILKVMSQKQGTRTNPVVVGDSVSVAEASVAELIRRLESGDVPDELRGAHVLRLHLSHVHVRLMTRADVDAWVAELRRTVAACTNAKAGMVIYVGDMRWAVDDEDNRSQAAVGFSPAEHMAAALARLLGELRAAGCGAWLVAAASYGTYMRCQRRGRALEATWALQPVAVPAGAGAGLDLALGPRATSPTYVKTSKLAQFPLLDFASNEEDSFPALCVECARNYKMEASAVRAKTEGTNLALTYFPGCLKAEEPQTSYKDELMELKIKWSSLCQRVHLQCSHPTHPSNVTSIGQGLCLSFDTPICHGTSNINHQDVNTKLCLLFPDSVETSNEVHRHASKDLNTKPTVQEPDLMLTSSDMKNVPLPWLEELPSGNLKQKVETGRLESESKRRRGSGGFDLNLCADDEDDGDGGSQDGPVPSDLTNDGDGSSNNVTDNLDSRN